MTPRIWVLADDRPGNVNQALGVAEALGLPFERIDVGYTRLARLPNRVRGASLLGVDAQSRARLRAPWPDLVIAAGRRTAPIARFIKSNNPACLTVQVMWPGAPTGGLDLIATPAHDRRPPEPGRGGATPHVMVTEGAPNRVTPARLRAARDQWRTRIDAALAGHEGPYIALIVGGSTKQHRFTVEQAARLGRLATRLARRNRAALLVTTSRRTDAGAVEALRAALDAPTMFHDWRDGGDNPYFGFLATADALVVTGDSMSMCSEAATTGKPVFIFADPDHTARKHAALHRALIERGAARPLDEDVAEKGVISWRYPPLDAAGTVADAIRRRLFSPTRPAPGRDAENEVAPASRSR